MDIDEAYRLIQPVRDFHMPGASGGLARKIGRTASSAADKAAQAIAPVHYVSYMLGKLKP